MVKKAGILLLLISTVIQGLGQELNVAKDLNRGSSIVDDSTRQIYGPTTTKIFSQEVIRYNLTDFQFIDTTIYNFDLEFDAFQRVNYEGQNLGNIGTAWRPFFPAAPKIIGSRPGFDVFESYYKAPEDIQLYDTKSPFTWFSVLWGGEGRNSTQVKFTRNINERWNFTLDYNSLLMDKQIGKERRGDRNVESYNYSFTSWYRSKNLKYATFLVLSRIKHNVNEMGGVDVDPVNGTPASFFVDTAQPLLRQTTNDELRREILFYQRYELSNLISLFHEMNWGYQENSLLVESSSESTGYFDFEEIPYDSEASDSSIFKTFTNKAGITGYTRGFNYELYLKGRKANFIYQYLDTDGTNIVPENFESYLGINIGTVIDSTFKLKANGELQDNGNYKLSGNIESKFLEADAGIFKYSPGFLQQGYRGHYDNWTNSFSPVESRFIKGKLKLSKWNYILEPEIYLNNLAGNIYFEKFTDLPDTQQVLPTQNQSSLSIISGGVRTGFRGKNAYALISGKLTTVSGDEANSIPIPEIMANLDLGITNSIFDKSMEVQIGLRTHWQSSYYGMGYDTAIQQFYIQNETEIPDYWFFTAYLNARVQKVKFFMKFNNIRKILNPAGYFPTPNYPGINGVFDFGFKWYFYD